MIFVEDQRSYLLRTQLQRDRREREVRRKWLLRDDLPTELLFETIREHGEAPIRITTLVNAVAEKYNYTLRAEREREKIRLFKQIGRFIRIGRLDRVGRKHVTIPRCNERYQAYLRALSEPLALPRPDV